MILISEKFMILSTLNHNLMHQAHNLNKKKMAE